MVPHNYCGRLRSIRTKASNREPDRCERTRPPRGKSLDLDRWSGPCSSTSSLTARPSPTHEQGVCALPPPPPPPEEGSPRRARARAELVAVALSSNADSRTRPPLALASRPAVRSCATAEYSRALQHPRRPPAPPAHAVADLPIVRLAHLRTAHRRAAPPPRVALARYKHLRRSHDTATSYRRSRSNRNHEGCVPLSLPPPWWCAGRGEREVSRPRAAAGPCVLTCTRSCAAGATCLARTRLSSSSTSSTLPTATPRRRRRRTRTRPSSTATRATLAPRQTTTRCASPPTTSPPPTRPRTACPAPPHPPWPLRPSPRPRRRRRSSSRAARRSTRLPPSSSSTRPTSTPSCRARRAATPSSATSPSAATSRPSRARAAAARRRARMAAAV